MNHADALKPGTEFGSYEIKEKLWASSAGFTYRARDLDRQREVMIQEYLPAEVAVRHWSGIHAMALEERKDVFERGLASFLQEARVLAQLSDQHLCRVREYTEANATAYLVMDYEPGETLHDLLRHRNTRLPEQEVSHILESVLNGLQVVHAAGLLHRDICPQHIYLRDNGVPLILGFGNTHRAESVSEVRLDSRVTPGYSPVELYHDGDQLGPWTDLYSLGAAMYRCLTGITPAEATKRVAALAQQEPDPLVAALEISGDGYGKDLSDTIDWMLNPVAKDRPDSVRAVLDCLKGQTQPERSPRKNKQGPGLGAKAGAAGQRQQALKLPPSNDATRPPRGTGLRSGGSADSGEHSWVKAGIAASLLAILAALVLWPEPAPEQQATSQTGPQEATQPAPAGERDTAASIDREPSIVFRQVDRETFLAVPPRLPDEVNFSRAGDNERAALYRELEKQEKKIGQLLSAARVKLQSGQLIDPVTDNALADYRAVLAIDSDNVDARQGIDSIAEQLVRQARAALGNGDLDAAQRLADVVADIDPGDPSSGELKDQIAARRSAAEAEEQQAILRLQRQEENRRQQDLADRLQQEAVQEQIRDLLALADAALAAQRLAEPVGDNALGYYRRVLEADPGNERANEGMAQVARVYLERATRAIAADQFEEAEGMLTAAAAIVPDNEAVPLLRDQLQLRRETVRKQAVAERAAAERAAAEQAARAQRNGAGDMTDAQHRRRRADLIRGIEAYYRGDYATAFQLLNPLAELGYARAQFRIGIMHHLGRGVSVNQPVAEDWIRKSLPRVQTAAAAGEAWAQADLGSLYADGLVLTKNDQEAIRWFQLAAEQGYAGAQTNLGVMYANGEGVNQNLDEGIKWLRRAAAQGDRVAKDNLVTLGVR
jgi:serine/threonine protein kinase